MGMVVEGVEMEHFGAVVNEIRTVTNAGAEVLEGVCLGCIYFEVHYNEIVAVAVEMGSCNTSL